MQVILTPTAVPDKFGAGLNGFKGSIPPLPPPTQLSAEWFDSVQMELVNILLSQGIALDGLLFDQIAVALANWTFTGDAVIAVGGSLTVEGGATVASGGSFTCSAGSTFTVNSSTPTFGASSEVNIFGDAIIGTDSGNMLTVEATTVVNGTSTFNAIINTLAGINLSTNEIEGVVGSIVDVDRVQVTTIELDDSDSSFSTTKGHVRLNDTAYMAANGATQTRAIEDPGRGYDASFTTVASLTDTTANTTRRVQENELVWVEMTCRFEIDVVPSDMNYGLKVAGPIGTVVVETDTYRAETAAEGYSMHRVFQWKPTDTWPGEAATQGYSFTLQLGATGGNTLSATNVAIKVSSALQVP